MPVPIVVICGATATGKSAVAAEVAARIGSEVINADSMQVFAELTIGTGKPDAETLARVPHHGIGHLSMSTVYSAAAFKRDMDPVLDRLIAANIPPVVCGGTGLYLRALIDGIFAGAPRNDGVRAELHARAATSGVTALHAELAAVDPSSATHISPTDELRIVRALEVFRLTGRPISALQSETTAPTAREHAHWFGIRFVREVLRQRIADRVAHMFDCGWIEETRSLYDTGAEADIRRLRPLGYMEILAALGRDSKNVRGAAEAETIIHTQQFAKRQGTWFRNQHPVSWLDADDQVAPSELADAICSAMHF